MLPSKKAEPAKKVRRTASFAKSKKEALRIGIVYIFFLSLCVVLCWLFLCILSKILCFEDIPFKWLLPLTTGCAGLSVLLGSMFYSRSAASHGMLRGLFIGAGSWIILCLCGLARDETPTKLSVLKLFALLCCGMIGGIAGTAQRERSKQKKPIPR